MLRAASIVNRVVLLSLTVLSWPRALHSDIVVVENTTGKIRVAVVGRDSVDIWAHVSGRAVRPNDVSVEHRSGGMVVRAEAADAAPIDITLDVPFQTSLSLTTTSGAIDVHGMPAALDIRTTSGDLELALPWKASYVDFRAEIAPETLEISRNLRKRRKGRGILVTNPTVGVEYRGYSDVRIRTSSSRHVDLREIDIPAESTVKLHWQASAALRRAFRRSDQPMRLRARGADEDTTFAFDSGESTFEAIVIVRDGKGRAVKDLSSSDFVVMLDGTPCPVMSARPEETPINVVLFLDWGNSMSVHRALTLQAVKSLMERLLPADRASLHVALRDTLFISPRLTEKAEHFERRRDAVNRLVEAERSQGSNATGGGATVWDTIALALTDELPDRDRQTNVFIPVTAGVGGRSTVSFSELRRKAHQLAEEANVTVYPVVPSYHRYFGPNPDADRHPLVGRLERGRRYLESLAETTRGSVFEVVDQETLGSALDAVLSNARHGYKVACKPAGGPGLAEAGHSMLVTVARPNVYVRHLAIDSQ